MACVKFSTLCVIFAISLSLPGAFGKITRSEIKVDTRPFILFDTFGFDPTGHVDITITGIKYHIESNGRNNKKMGFIIISEEGEIRYLAEENRTCVLDSKVATKVFTFQDVEASYLATRKSNKDSVNLDLKDFTYVHKFHVPMPNEYSIFFANCEEHVAPSFNLEMSLYNVEAGGKKDFLPSGQTQLPKLYFFSFLAYLAAGAAWVYICFKQKATVHRIHILMAVLVYLKALTVLSQAGEYAYIKTSGVAHGWNIVYYIFSFFRGIMLFTVIVLIGTGWSFLKPFLQDKEKKIIMIVIPLQVLVNIAYIILDESGPSSKEWFTWTDIFHILDIICCCAIFFPIVWSIRHLREASHTDGKAARNMHKLTLFRQFYVIVVSYVYFTRIVVYLLKRTTPYHYAWTANLSEEVATLLFYCFTGYKFRPVEHNPYFVLDEEEEEAAAQALKDDEFDL